MRRERACHLQALGLDCGIAAVDEARHLTWMRGQHNRNLGVMQNARVGGQAIETIGIDDQGLLAMGEQPAGQPDRIGRDPNSWTEGYRALSLQRLRDRPLIEHETAI